MPKRYQHGQCVSTHTHTLHIHLQIYCCYIHSLHIFNVMGEKYKSSNTKQGMIHY